MLDFHSITIKRPESWEPTQTGFKGELKLKGQSTGTELLIRLSDQQCRQMLAIVGQAVEDTGKAAGQVLMAEALALPKVDEVAMLEGGAA